MSTSTDRLTASVDPHRRERAPRRPALAGDLRAQRELVAPRARADWFRAWLLLALLGCALLLASTVTHPWLTGVAGAAATALGLLRARGYVQYRPRHGALGAIPVAVMLCHGAELVSRVAPTLSILS